MLLLLSVVLATAAVHLVFVAGENNNMELYKHGEMVIKLTRFHGGRDVGRVFVDVGQSKWSLQAQVTAAVVRTKKRALIDLHPPQLYPCEVLALCESCPHEHTSITYTLSNYDQVRSTVTNTDYLVQNTCLSRT